MSTQSQDKSWISGMLRPTMSAALAFVFVVGIATQSARAQTFTLLYSFTGKSDGGIPQGGLVRDPAGNLYGTTSQGGLLRDCAASGIGVVFKVDKSGKETVLHNFKGSDGALPLGSLIRDGEGNLYGATFAGGVGNCFMGKGCGVVFKLDKTGKETVLYAFTGGSDGGEPQRGGALIRDKAGNLYGTTVQGGVNCDNQSFGCGVVFKLDKTGKETVLYTFTGGSDGAEPLGGLTRDQAGNLYGSDSVPILERFSSWRIPVRKRFCTHSPAGRMAGSLTAV
jgi:uncharacterized repeat protein (TIGR03803 family)